MKGTKMFMALPVTLLAVLFVCISYSIPAVSQQVIPSDHPAMKMPFAVIDQELPRAAEVPAILEKVMNWWASVEVDAVRLADQGIKGVKKVGESLSVASTLLTYSTTPSERQKILQSTLKLLDQVGTPRYHRFLLQCSDKQFNENSMSYFRVLKLMEQMKLDTTYYKEQIPSLVPRLDEKMPTRGPWQRAMFAKYYDEHGIAKPDVLKDEATLKAAQPQQQIIPNRIPAHKFSRNNVYTLTHEVFVAFDYGLEKVEVSSQFSPQDLEYLSRVLRELTQQYMEQKDPDLVAELVECMQYLEIKDHPTYREAIGFLLDSVNPNGSIGDYGDSIRAQTQVYLHTVGVAIQALCQEFYGPIWKYRSEATVV